MAYNETTYEKSSKRLFYSYENYINQFFILRGNFYLKSDRRFDITLIVIGQFDNIDELSLSSMLLAIPQKILRYSVQQTSKI